MGPVYEVMENAGFGLLCRTGRAAPRLIPRLNKLTSAALSRRSYSDRSYRVFTTPRRVRFIESEFAIPFAAAPDVLAELQREVPKLADPVMFPVEVRVAAADDIWRLRELYPRFGDFIRVRDEADPAGRFTNRYLDRVLGPPPGQADWAGLPADRPG